MKIIFNIFSTLFMSTSFACANTAKVDYGVNKELDSQYILYIENLDNDELCIFEADFNLWYFQDSSGENITAQKLDRPIGDSFAIYHSIKKNQRHYTKQSILAEVDEQYDASVTAYIDLPIYTCAHFEDLNLPSLLSNNSGMNVNMLPYKPNNSEASLILKVRIVLN